VTNVSEDQEFIDSLTREYLSDPEPSSNTNGYQRNGTGLGLEDAEIITLCRKAANASKFSALFDEGDTSGHGSDDSSADIALMCILAFYTRDPAQLERLFGLSRLGHRPKWIKRTDYRRRTVDRALEKVTEHYSGAKSKPQDEVRSRSRYLGYLGMSNDRERGITATSFRGREKPGPREWIVANAICKGHVASWYGEGGIAKSLIASHLGLCVASPSFDYWAGLRVQTVPVLYCDFELDEQEHLRRCQELAAGMGLDDVPTHFYYLELAGLPTPEAFALAAQEARRLQAGLVIVDSVGFALDGDSEVAKDVLRFHKEYIGAIREAGATPLLIDHQAKVIKGEKYSDKQEFGSVYKFNAARSSFQIRGAWDGNELTTTFTHKKTNFGPKIQDFSLKLVFRTGRVEVTRLGEAVPNPDKAPSKKERVYAAVEELGLATAETVSNKTNIKLQTVRNAISELLAEGKLEDTGQKQGRSRLVVTHSQTTKGTGTGMTAQADTNGDLTPEEKRSVRELVDSGMMEKIAREEVLRKRRHEFSNNRFIPGME
jgi:hypothetical protein